MITRNGRKVLSVAISFVLVAVSSQTLYGNQSQNSTPSADSGNPTDAAPMSATELQSLVAPIALYPDSLVAQILSASTFPDQVAIANYWIEQNKNLTGNALMQAVFYTWTQPTHSPVPWFSDAWYNELGLSIRRSISSAVCSWN